MPLNVLTFAPNTLLNGVIYALPQTKCMLFTSAATPSLLVSHDPAFATSVAVVLTNGQVELGAGFIKAAADTPVILKQVS